MQIRYMQKLSACRKLIFTPPARRAWRSCKFAPFLFFFHLSMSKVGLPLMGDTGGFFLLFSALYATYHLNPFYSRICQQITDFI